MDERRALMAATIADPDEDTPRLALADWLQENGDEHDRARAEFIRFQVREARLPEDSAVRAKLAKQSARLREKHVAAWLGPLAEFCKLDLFERGLLAGWHATSAAFLAKTHQVAVRAGFPNVGIDALQLSESSKRGKDVAASPALEWVGQLCWLRAGIGDDGMKALADSPHTFRVSKFLVTNPGCTNDGVRAFARSKCWPNLRSFGIRGDTRNDRYGYGAATALLASDRLPKLDAIDLGGTWLDGTIDKSKFYSHPGLARLRSLRLEGPADVAALAMSPHPTGLEALYVAYADIDAAAALALADSPAFAKLKKVTLYGINTYQPRLSEAATGRLRDRFGDGLVLHYSPLAGRG